MVTNLTKPTEGLSWPIQTNVIGRGSFLSVRNEKAQCGLWVHRELAGWSWLGKEENFTALRKMCTRQLQSPPRPDINEEKMRIHGKLLKYLRELKAKVEYNYGERVYIYIGHGCCKLFLEGSTLAVSPQQQI